MKDKAGPESHRTECKGVAPHYPPMRLLGLQTRGEKASQHNADTPRVSAVTTCNKTQHGAKITGQQSLPTCDFFAHTHETKSSDLFRSHV